jgi:hypothetical protein
MVSKVNKSVLIPVTILGALALSVAGLVNLSLMTGTYEITSSASVQTPPEIGVYWDITTLDDVTEIAWGDLEPGETKSVTVYVKNTGETVFTGSLSTDSWNPPEASDFITLDWDFGSNPLKVGRIRTTQLTLRVDSGITGITVFNFTIIITGTEYIS